MNERLLLLRKEKDLSWKTLKLVPHKFDPRKYPGYRYYKSFPADAKGKAWAQEYAKGVEGDERNIIRR